MDLPLTITSIMRYGTSVFGDGEVVTWTGDGTRRRTYAEAGRRAAASLMLSVCSTAPIEGIAR